jgi:glycosyltransferase involved in cell wall biosynthesis
MMRPSSPHAQPETTLTAAVSVVVPCYRCSKTVHRAIASVAAQTCRPQEVILVEDGSGDETLSVLQYIQREYGEDWIKIIPLRVNIGSAAARNAGWDAAIGDYIAFLDADDSWHSDKIRLQYEFMLSHQEFALTGHGHLQLEHPPSKHLPVAQSDFHVISYRSLLLSNRFITPSVMIRRETPFRFHADMRHMEDFHLLLTIAASGHRIAFLDAELAYIFKAIFGEVGLSADILEMEKGELDCYWNLHHAGYLGILATLALSAYSCAKFLRRAVLTGFMRTRPRARNNEVHVNQKQGPH